MSGAPAHAPAEHHDEHGKHETHAVPHKSDPHAHPAANDNAHGAHAVPHKMDAPHAANDNAHGHAEHAHEEDFLTKFRAKLRKTMLGKIIGAIPIFGKWIVGEEGGGHGGHH